MLLTSGDSTGLSGVGIAGRVLLILTEVIALLVLALLFAACTIRNLCYEGNHSPLQYLLLITAMKVTIYQCI